MNYKPSDSEAAHLYLDKCFEKKRHVKIEPVAKAKTINQNNYLWLVFTIIADDTGNSPKDIYEYYLDRFAYYKDIDIHSEVKRVRISLSKFNQQQASDFIDRVVIDARQEGHVIPDPDDNRSLEAFNYYREKGLL